MNTRVMGAVLATLVTAVPAQAALIVNTGVSNIGTDNVLHNTCAGLTTVGTTIQGCLNQNHNVIVDFTSDEALKYAAGGQAQIVAVVGTFDNLTISISQPQNTTFSKLVLNIDAAEDGFVTFFGVPGGFPTPPAYALDGGGQNFFTITGEDFASVKFTTTVGVTGIDIVNDVKQVRLGGLLTSEPQCPTLPIPCVINPEVIVPEPATLVMLGMGLLGAGFMRRRRQ